MKKVTIIASLLLGLISCNSKKETKNEIGYIVQCDYEHSRMCCSDSHFDKRLIVVVHTHHTHVLKPAQFNVYFANASGVKSLEVDSVSWFQLAPGNKVLYSVDTNNVEHIYKIK